MLSLMHPRRPFTRDAEIINGRIGMVGFALLILVRRNPLLFLESSSEMPIYTLCFASKADALGSTQDTLQN